jgi:hypothetical protein
MRLFLSVLVTALIVPLAAYAQAPKQIEVINDPLVVEVTNLPPVQDVTGTVEVTNLPTPMAAARYQLVGFTSLTFDGGQGIRTYTQACQSDFTLAARMCTSEEVLNTIHWPNVPAATRGWVRPVYQSATASEVVDASGRAGSVGSGALSCGGWGFASNTRHALAVSGDGRFVTPGFNDTCDVGPPDRLLRRCPLDRLPRPSIRSAQGPPRPIAQTGGAFRFQPLREWVFPRC